MITKVIDGDTPSLEQLESRRCNLGQRVHQVESGIHWGKSIVAALVQEEPVDQAALEIARTNVHDARMQRNELIGILNAVKDEITAHKPLPSGWLR